MSPYSRKNDMAYTRIHGIKSTLSKALAYIENPDKTDEQILVSGYQVDPLSASIEFEMTSALARNLKGDYTKSGGANNLAYHMIQSFAPYDKLTAEEAHALGKKWADEVLEGHYEYVLTTHVDKGHIHNHVIFNAVSFYDYKKYNNYKVAGRLREISDKLCEMEGLYVIKNAQLSKKSQTHYEWEQRKAGASWKAKIQAAIDEAIDKNVDYEGFKDTLAAQGIEIKEGQRISFRITVAGQERFSRGDRIGEDYTRERILERLAQPQETRAPRRPAAAEYKRKPDPAAAPATRVYDNRFDWAARRKRLAETKELAAALLTIRTENIQGEGDFDARIDALAEKAAGIRETLKEASEENKQYQDLAKYLLSYHQYLPIKEEAESKPPYQKSRFRSVHEGELLALDHAIHQLAEFGVDTQTDPDEVFAIVREHSETVATLSKSLEDLTAKMNAIKKAQQLIDETADKQKEAQVKKEAGQRGR